MDQIHGMVTFHIFIIAFYFIGFEEVTMDSREQSKDIRCAITCNSSEYSYFDNAKLLLWAGPSYWKAPFPKGNQFSVMHLMVHNNYIFFECIYRQKREREREKKNYCTYQKLRMMSVIII